MLPKIYQNHLWYIIGWQPPPPPVFHLFKPYPMQIQYYKLTIAVKNYPCPNIYMEK